MVPQAVPTHSPTRAPVNPPTAAPTVYEEDEQTDFALKKKRSHDDYFALLKKERGQGQEHTQGEAHGAYSSKRDGSKITGPLLAPTQSPLAKWAAASKK
jgi:hypothetical protein